MSYVSEAVRVNFIEREHKVMELIRQSGITYRMVGVFGSYAREEYKSTSDIDFCVVVQERPSHEISGSLREEADLLDADVIFVTEEYFWNDMSEFAKNLRKDFKRIDEKPEVSYKSE